MFEKNLKYYRLKKNMTKRALAEACGVTPMAITNYESGKRRPEMAIIKKMAEALFHMNLVIIWKDTMILLNIKIK